MSEKKELLVCASCGSKAVQTKAWVDANTNEYIDDCGSDGDEDDNFCGDCNSNTTLVLESEFEPTDEEDEEEDEDM
jgi:hypothetical protein